MQRVITVRRCTEKAGEQVQRQKSAKLGRRLSLMDSIAAALSPSSGWAPPAAASRPGHAERVDAASPRAEGFASDTAGFPLQPELLGKEKESWASQSWVIVKNLTATEKERLADDLW